MGSLHDWRANVSQKVTSHVPSMTWGQPSLSMPGRLHVHPEKYWIMRFSGIILLCKKQRPGHYFHRFFKGTVLLFMYHAQKMRESGSCSQSRWPEPARLLCICTLSWLPVAGLEAANQLAITNAWSLKTRVFKNISQGHTLPYDSYPCLWPVG